MNKISRRPNREEIKKTRKEAKKAQKALRNALESEGMKPFAHSAISNCKCRYENVEEETAARTEIVTDQVWGVQKRSFRPIFFAEFLDPSRKNS